MRYNLPKSDIIEEMVEDTIDFFKGNNIDVTKATGAVYNDLFCSMVINALDFFVEWRFLKEKEINKTLDWIYFNKCQSKDQMAFYRYRDAEDHLNLSMARLRVIVEKKLNYPFQNEEHREHYLNELMNKYYYHVLDAVDIKLKILLTAIIGGSTWDVFDVVQYRRNIELVSYGDFRILTWEMLRSK